MKKTVTPMMNEHSEDYPHRSMPALGNSGLKMPGNKQGSNDGGRGDHVGSKPSMGAREKGDLGANGEVGYPQRPAAPHTGLALPGNKEGKNDGGGSHDAMASNPSMGTREKGNLGENSEVVYPHRSKVPVQKVMPVNVSSRYSGKEK